MTEQVVPETNVESNASNVGLVVAGMRMHKDLRLEGRTAEQVITASGVSRTQVYAAAREYRATAALRRSPGRPRKETPVLVDSTLQLRYLVSAVVRDWLYANPGGAALAHERMRHSDPFRVFVLGLLAPGGLAHALTQEQAAEAIGISRHTLSGWLAAGRKMEAAAPAPEVTTAAAEVADPAEPLTPDIPPPVSGRDAEAAQIIDLWQRWKGSLGAFYRSLPEHGINRSFHNVRTILGLDEKRKLNRRKPGNPDPEALRGLLERFLPNCQWHEDGKTITATVGDVTFAFTLQWIVDNGSDAILGLDIRDHEDAQGVLNAYRQAKESAGEPPEGFTRDHRKSNTAKPISDQLAQDNVVDMFSPVKRPQSNAPVETANSTLSQSLPPVSIPANLSPRDLARLVLLYYITGYAIGRNWLPRKRLSGKSPAKAMAEDRATPEEREQARRTLTDIRDRISAQDRANRRRCQPATLAIVEETFKELGFDDPMGRFATTTASYGLAAAFEAIAIYKAKLESGTAPVANPERYVMRTAMHIAYRIEDVATYEHLLDLRARAGDIVLAPLKEHEARLRSRLNDTDYAQAVFGQAILSPARVDRTWWRRVFLTAFEQLPVPERPEAGRWYVRKIAACRNLPWPERDHFIAELAALAVPLAA